MKQNLDSFDYVKTKRNVNIYFENLEKLKLKQARLSTQKGLTATYGFSLEEKKQPYIRIGKDEFNLSAIETNNEEIAKHISDFYWAQSVLSDDEQIYIKEYFENGKYEKEVVDLLGFNSSDNWIFRKIKRSAIYKFAYVLNLLA